MNAHFRNFALWVIIGLLLIALFQLFQRQDTRQVGSEIPFSQFLNQAEQGDVTDVTIQGQLITGEFRNGGRFQSYAPESAGEYVELLRSQGVRINARPPSENFSLLGALISWFPMLIILGIWIFVMRQMQGGAGGKAMGFGKSKAKMLTEKSGRVTFDDVAGIDEAKSELQEIVEFLGGSKAKAQLLGAEIITNHDQYVRDVDQLRQRLRETYRGLLLPRGLFVQTWDMVTGICLLYTLFVTTYEVGLDLPTKLDALFVINQCVSLVFLTDIVVQFFLPVPDLSKGEGAYERRHYMLAKKYICSWFCLDLVTIVPFDVLVMSGALSGPVKMTKIMRVLRLFKLVFGSITLFPENEPLPRPHPSQHPTRSQCP